MRISGHRTDSMERRYNIVDIEDIQSAKALMQKVKFEKIAFLRTLSSKQPTLRTGGNLGNSIQLVSPRAYLLRSFASFCWSSTRESS
jgi:hypothetical protein